MTVYHPLDQPEADVMVVGLGQRDYHAAIGARLEAGTEILNVDL